MEVVCFFRREHRKPPILLYLNRIFVPVYRFYHYYLQNVFELQAIKGMALK